MNKFIPLSLLGLNLVSSQVLAQETAKIAGNILSLESYVLSLSIRKVSPIENTTSVCSGFIVDRSRGLVASSLHCVPESEKIYVPGEIRFESGKILESGSAEILVTPQVFVEGTPAKIHCSDPTSDLVVLKVDSLSDEKKTPSIDQDPEIGDSYTAILSNRLGGGLLQTTKYLPPNHSIQFPVHLQAQGKIIEKSPGFLVDKTTGNRVPILTEMLFTDTVLKGGFSGGPLLTNNGTVLGVVHGYDGGFGMATSIKNLRQLLSSDDCKL